MKERLNIKIGHNKSAGYNVNSVDYNLWGFFSVSGTRLPILLRVPFTQRAQQPRQTDYPQTRNSKSMDLVADESNMRSLAEQSPEVSSRGSDLGPTLGLWKSCSLESHQSAMSEARQLSQVPFPCPRPHIVRGRGCNQSFRTAIDKSYDGPSESEDGSGCLRLRGGNQ
ncbi:partitioning defective 3 homolog B [Salmo salar]|uniref:Partitioning defective 3 homolog B n=1 Tax=Salmo salar TaxID=8030 RepID=A0A1S3MR81_SALSA|nr:partitioning defective 3 homolog B-like [Salmo salar]|eukprot:XP_014005649.1 PREDICTED: partitioning defective 3 homolog B-like [Salmo salar]